MLFETLGAEPPQSRALYQDEFMLTFAMDMPIGKLAKMMAEVDSEQAISAWIDRLNEQRS
ncbi:hypothetical protein GNF83_19175 [Clostridium perfringens]|uniref:Uncharacterized protein n=1 Tax=Clostridium perfringens TaxID=1502 RepID=A0AAW9KFT7_CLOPF|nr:hypothetical protein [Clostridium perfringens]